VSVAEENRLVPIDTGFMVFNEVTYPNLTRSFANSACHQAHQDVLQRAASADRPGILRHQPEPHLRPAPQPHPPRFWKMVGQINRFNTEAVETLSLIKFSQMTLGDYVRLKKYGDDFLNFYLVPMSSAVWSTPPALMLEFPAVTLLRFFHNHGFLGLHTQHPWFTSSMARNPTSKRSPRRSGTRSGCAAVRPASAARAAA